MDVHGFENVAVEVQQPDDDHPDHGHASTSTHPGACTTTMLVYPGPALSPVVGHTAVRFHNCIIVWGGYFERRIITEEDGDHVTMEFEHYNRAPTSLFVYPCNLNPAQSASSQAGYLTGSRADGSGDVWIEVKCPYSIGPPASPGSTALAPEQDGFAGINHQPEERGLKWLVQHLNAITERSGSEPTSVGVTQARARIIKR